ncbi:MAG TPA: dihydrolipoyl dehydrogenase [Desulfomonilaceae bacterium]|nr:dihydrolipoyl dehydrogenase [Desulfomonilaceae bacterium]
MVVGDFAQGTQVAVIGAGPGGYVAAIRAAQLGLEVTLVEKDLLGGVCLNCGCIPSKALIYVADLKNRIEHADKIGLIVADVKVDLPKLVGWKNEVVDKLRKGVVSLLAHHKVQVVKGTAHFTSDHSFTVEGPDGVHRFEFQGAILATGSSAAQLPGIPHDGELVIDSTEALDPKNIPERLVVVGAGAVGLELGTFYAKMGTDVTILEAAEKLLPALDSDIGKVMERALKSYNIKLMLGARVLGLNRNGSRGELKYSIRGSEQTISTDRILVGIGRRPNTTGIGLEKAGVKLDSHGFVEVDARMQTSVPGIFAIGDMVPGHMLAHKASFQGKVAAEVIAGLPAAFEGVEVPGVIFSDPEIATVGLGEEEARAKHVDVKVGVFPFKALGRAMTMGEERFGFSKVVSDAQTGTVLGVHIVGPHASDLISEGSLAVASASHVDDLALTIHPHPTLPESIEEAAEEVEHRAIHIFSPAQSKNERPE